VLAIQEPQFNRFTLSTYCPKPYELAYEATPETRVCFMIKRDVGAAQWRRKQYGPNVASLTLLTNPDALTIINVYNPRERGPRIKEWARLQLALKEAEGEILIVGDFNTHHAHWGGIGTACEPQADHLHQEMRRRQISLLTPSGEITWRRGTQATVIDLTYATQETRMRVEFCGPEARWALTSDHIPIRITLSALRTSDPNPRKRYALQRLDSEALAKALRVTGWETSAEPLKNLHESIEALLPQFCPKARPSVRARPDWSPRASELLAGVRRARRRLNASGQEVHRVESRSLSNQLKKEIKRVARANWRRVVEDLTQERPIPDNKGLWRLSRWSRRSAGKPHADPHLPELRRSEGEQTTGGDQERATILQEKFFPPSQEAVSVRTACEQHATRTPPIQINQTVSKEEMEAILRALPAGKAPGPDGIPNEVLKILAPEISKGLAHAVSKLLAGDTMPIRFRESTTLALRKEGKKDYSLPGSYRPIALENTLAKVVEKVLANRLSLAAEEHGLLPWTQMGARKDRSTLSAIGMLTTCVHTAWSARPGSVVSMLSLDLAGAFDNVPHDRLLEILQRKGLPEWLVTGIAGFLQGRRTRIAYPGFESEWIATNRGIPQGSPLSPILFLFFASGLLERFQDPSKGLIGLGFVDDTNLVTWSASAEQNCRMLTAAHTQCVEWAKDNGAKFAPEKYQLIHFTRQRRHAREDLASTMRINGHSIALQDKAIRVLGVWLDPSLSWKEHIAQAARKGLAASEALARLATSTWGPSARNSKLLYTAVVRPTLLYSAQEWAMRKNGEPLANSTLAPLEKVQNKCLRRVLGGYKRTPRAALQRESQTPPIDLYIEQAKAQRALSTKHHQVEASIAALADAVWSRMRRAGRTQASRTRQQTGREITRRAAEKKAQAAREEIEANHRRRRPAREPHATQPSQTHNEKALIAKWMDLAWHQRWTNEDRRHNSRHRAMIWNTPWSQDTRMLYAGLSKAEATALLLMRTEVIGLNAWLASVQVPGVSASCACGWHAQTVRHVLLHCPLHDRRDLLARCGTERFEDILMRPDCAKHAARWLTRSGIMDQFKVAAEIVMEDVGGYQPFAEAEEW